MLSIKPGVRVHGLSPEILLAVVVANEEYTKLGYDLTLTSIVDGKHSGGSKHYVGHAVDLRTREMPEDIQKIAHKAIRDALGADYDVVLEKDHMHLEFDPKTGVNL